MFHRFFIVLWLYFFVVCMVQQPSFAQSTSKTKSNSTENSRNFVPGEMVLKVHSNIEPNRVNSLNETHNSKIIEGLHSLALYRLKVSKPLEEVISLYQSDPRVEYAKPNYIFADIGGKYVSLMDIEFSILNMIPVLRQRYTQPQAKEKLVHFIVNDKLFSTAAKDANLSDLPEVKRKIDAAVEKILASEYRKRLQPITVSEKELIAYYNENIEKFITPEQIKGRRILVEAKQEADEILEHLKAGADFADIAREKSKDATAKRGGAFGWLARGQMVPAVERVAFALSKGEVSGIISTKYGHYIIKVEDKKAPRQKVFSTVRNQIQQRLMSKKRKEQLAQKTIELEEKYGVKLYPEFFSEIDVSVTKATNQQDILQIIKEAIEKPY